MHKTHITNIIILFVIIGVILIISCLSVPASKKENYELVSAVPFSMMSASADICTSVNYGSRSNGGFDAALQLKTVDYDTDADLVTSGEVSFANSETGFDKDTVLCFNKMISPYVDVGTYAKGHTPMEFRLRLQKDKFITVRVPLKKSCSEEKYDFKNDKYFFGEISNAFGLKEESYKLKCMESHITRGGYVKSTGLYLDRYAFELFYHYGSCSSGGADCGYNVCFSTENSELFDSVSKYVCDRLNESDKANCMNHEFDYKEGNKKIISLVTSDYGTVKGESDCLGY